MARLNLTLDGETLHAIERHAKEHETTVAGAARGLLRAALDRVEAARRQRKLAADYAAGRKDARRLLREMQDAQAELLGEP